MTSRTKSNSNDISKISPNALNKDGTVKKLETQFKEMLDNPSTFGLSMIDIGNSLEFANVYDNHLFISRKDLMHMLEHNETYNDVANILEKIKDQTIIATDYTDNRGGEKKTIIVLDNDVPYIVSLSQKEYNKISIERVTTLYDYGYDDLVDYINKSIDKGNQFYLNEKSSDFISRFILSRDSVDHKTTAYFNNLLNNNGKVKLSKGELNTDKSLKVETDNDGNEMKPKMVEYLSGSIGDRVNPYDPNSKHMVWFKRTQ